MIGPVVRALAAEALGANERRLLVLAGGREAVLDAAGAALDAVSIDRAGVPLIADAPALGCEHVTPPHAGRLLGTTNPAVVFCAHDGLDPNALGRVVGAVDGGGLLVLACPPLDGWADRRDPFDEALAVPPDDVSAVTGHFRGRFVDTLRAHPGVAIVDVDAGRVERDGLTRPAPRLGEPAIERPAGHAFPDAAYDACLTQDQVDALAAFEALRSPGTAVVLEADRGRGKSSVAGLAAACLAAAGEDVLVTAPAFRSAREAFVRAAALLEALGAGPVVDAVAEDVDGADAAGRGVPRRLEADGGGLVRFAPPAAVDPTGPDVLVVDEAAAVGVPLLASFLAADRVAFTTTIHGYEGTGRGFAVRFRDRLAASDLDVAEVTLEAPVRYAAGDPLEVWAFRALLLDASPAVDPVVESADPGTVTYRALPGDELVADEPRLRETFGLLVLAHYRTEPADLARLLDAPNVAARALLHDGHVVSVALLAREGGLSADRRAALYGGDRIRGNMLPDVLTSQLRDEAAGGPVGRRVMRVATHPAVRSRGIGSALLDAVHDEFGADVDWFGVGYGATPRLVSFWADNGYGTVHLSTTRNDASGEHSALMLRPASGDGRALHRRHADWFAARVGSQLSGPLRDLDPDVVRAALRATDATVEPALDDDAWRLVAGVAYGPGIADVDLRPFRRLAAAHLIDPADPALLSDREERLLVRRILQGRPWRETTRALGFHGIGACMRALGDAYRPLVEASGSAAARDEADRYRD